MQSLRFPSDFRTSEIQHQRHDDPRPLRRKRPGGRAAARLRRDRRHVGADGRRSRARPHRRGAGPARLGLSSKPAGGFDKKTQAGDVAGVLDELEIDRADLVTHDIGNMVGYAFAAQYPKRVTRFVLIDAPVPGVGPWEEILKNPLLWHFRFGGPDMERLVAGRERIYLDRFWNEFSATPSRFSEAAREHYAKLYALPGAMHSGFMQFAAFDQDAIDNRAFVRQGQARHAGAGNRRREVIRHPDGDDHAVRGQQRARGRDPQLRSLDHGGKPGGNDRHGAQLPGPRGNARLANVIATEWLLPRGSDQLRVCPTRDACQSP